MEKERFDDNELDEAMRVARRSIVHGTVHPIIKNGVVTIVKVEETYQPRDFIKKYLS